MAESFENRLIRIAGEDNFKKGKQLLKAEGPVCAFRGAKNTLNAVFRDKKGHINRVEVNSADNTHVCNCTSTGNGLCEHAVAAILYFSRFNTRLKTEEEEPARYRGLKYEAFSDLTGSLASGAEAELMLYAESAFPHVPSKFEHALLRVKLVVGNREYMGNLNNLRQLHFGKTLTTSLKISQFSQQDRQIIRFLSINAEPDGSRLTLDAEQTAEFFHCLAGFEHFFRDGVRVTVHRGNAEPVLLYQPSPTGCLLRSSLMIDGALLLLNDAKVITGRCGCWVGMRGEYWWVPATVDVAWLRSFLRTSEQNCNEDAARQVMNEKDNLPVKIMRFENGNLEKRTCNLLYDVILTREGYLEIQLTFDYNGIICDPDGSKFGNDGKLFYLRDTETEKNAVDELLQFGFKQISAPSSKPAFRIHDLEAAGIFCDILIPEWYRGRRRFYLSQRLSGLCLGDRGLPELTLACKTVSAEQRHYLIEYELCGNSIRFSWKDIFQAVKSHQHYWLYAGKLFKIDEKLRRFMLSVAGVIQPVSGEQYILRVPKNTIPFWISVASGIAGAIPPEFYAFSEMLSHPEQWSEGLNSGEPPFKLCAELRGYQRHGVDWMRQMSDRGFNVILADEMGLGKTIQALAVLASRVGPGSAPALVICPTSLVDNWKRETEKFIPGFRADIISGSNRAESWERYRDYNLIITSYSIVKRDYEHLAHLNFSYMILDEAQHIKNPSTANARICKAIDSDHRLVLTGTPLENSPEDLWSIFDFLHPDMLGSFNGFKKYYEDIATDKQKQHTLSARVAPFILRRKKAEVCRELPPKQEQTLFCDFEPEQRRLYRRISDTAREEFRRLAAKPGSKLEILTILMRLRQACCHPALLPAEMLGGKEIASAKMELMKELVLENIDSGHKMLLFSQFTSLLRLIASWLEEEKIAYEYLDGSTRNRQERVDSFNLNPDIPLFLLSLKAGGTGLNLTSADTVIIFDPWWNPAVEAQAADRSHRIGQQNPVTSIKLVVRDTVEEKILELQQRKAEIFRSLIDDQAGAMEKISIEELEFLFG